MRPQLDQHSHGHSPIHRLRAGSKLAAALLLVLTAVAVPLTSWPLFLALGVLLLLIAAVSRLPTMFLLRRMLLLEPFVLGVALLVLLQPNGLMLFLLVLLRSTLCLFTMVLLAATTPFPDLLAVLRWLRLPRLLVTTLALMYRYLFVLADEAMCMHRARMSRSFTSRRWPGWKALATVIAQLFVRATARAERIYAAMLARGYR